MPAKEPKTKRLPTTLVPEAAPAVEPQAVAPPTDLRSSLQAAIAAALAVHKPAEVAAVIRAAMRQPKAKTGAASLPVPKFGPDAVLTLLCDGNPKKPGCKGWHRWEAGYASGKTVAQTIKDGVLMADIKYDIAHGFVRVDPA